MCGIIGYTGPRDAAPVLLDGLRKLEYRGYDSAGVALIDPGVAGVQLVRRAGKLANLEAALETTPVTGRCGLGHTRWATHGPPSEANAHPHRAGHLALVHNGIIENHAAFRSELHAGGRALTSQTDTEVVAHLIETEMAAQGCDLRTAVLRIQSRLAGSWALAVVHDAHPDTLVVARHNSPLLVGLGGPREGVGAPGPENFIASDVSALLPYTRTVMDLEEGDVAVVTPETVEIFDVEGAPVRRARRHVDWSPMAAEKQGFKHFMLKEIHEQPRAIRDTMLGATISDQGDDVHLDGLDLPLQPESRLVLVACGTSWHAALTAKYLIERLARIPVEVDLASEFRYRDPILRPADIVVAITQSGETADTLAALREAKRRGTHTIAICNVQGSSITRLADQVLYTRAGPEISVASTKAFTTQLTMVTLLAVHLGRRAGTLSSERARELLSAMRGLPALVEHLLGQLSAVRIIARRYMGARDCLYLGRGLCFPAALEGALKLKEISYVHAEGYASGEMKHGPIALVDENVPVIVLALRGPGYEKAVSNLEEVRARGGKIIALATMGDRTIGDLADDLILIPDVVEELQPIAVSVSLQLLAYHFADLKGTDVDQPRNLAKSVTVE